MLLVRAGCEDRDREERDRKENPHGKARCTRNKNGKPVLCSAFTIKV